MPCTSYGRQGRRGGSPKREEKTVGAIFLSNRKMRQKFENLRRKWHEKSENAGLRVPPELIHRFKQEAGLVR